MMSTQINVKPLGRRKDEKAIRIVEIESEEARITFWSWGARIQSWEVKHHGKWRSVIKSPSDPRDKMSHAGAAIGRVSNKIGKAKFELNGQVYNLEANAGEDHLHGGSSGFHTLNWNLSEIRPHEGLVRFYTVVNPADDNYPGKMEVTLTYRLQGKELTAEFRAQSSHDTLFAPTIHPYFNLTGESKVHKHFLNVPLNYFQRLEDGLSKGRPSAVKGWNDLRKRVRLDKLLTGPRKNEMDLCWVEDGFPRMLHLATLSADNGLSMEVHSTLPAIQVFTSSTLKAEGLRAFSGIALEPEYPPNSANRVLVNRMTLEAGIARAEIIAYRWSSEEK